ncbi:MAG: flippase activity-associated protein Agl23 [Opitutus sp.]
MPVSVPRWLPLVLIALAALWLRTSDLAHRPMHADEANQAVKTGELLESGRYAFDPKDHHGPTLYYAALPIAWIRGEHSLADLTETTVRLVPAIFGTLGVIFLGLLARPLGQRPAIAAAAFLAVSPPAVYYSRYFIQETLLVTFTLGAFWCASRWTRQRKLGWAIAAGVAVGLMQSTKASAPLFLLAGVVAFLAFRPKKVALAASASADRPAGDMLLGSKRPGSAVALGVLAALVVAVVFYSSFGTHWSGLRDALSVYGPAAERATGESGHEKPWWYYLWLFGWHREGGILWQQVAFSFLTVMGLVVAFTRRANVRLRQAAVYTLIITIALSMTPYKTPWHAVHFVPGFAVLAAGSLTLLPWTWMRIAVALGVLVAQLAQTKLVAFSRPADARNPYAYVHSAPDVLKIRALTQNALNESPSAPVRVIGEEYWPLPWYLRGLPRIGYWASPPADCDGALVISSMAAADAVRARMRQHYRETLVGLRPDVPLIVFTPIP